MSVSNKFKSFCHDISIQAPTRGNISARYKRITKQLNTDFWGSDSETNHSLYVGSYGRDTAIHVSDIDMLMILPVSYYHSYNSHEGNGQSALLQAVKNSIKNTYPTTRLKGDGQVVIVAFNDGVKFEILPCFPREDGKGYLYPDTHDEGSWKTTNPEPEIKAIREANTIWNYNLKLLCRMARAWKDQWNVPMGGILIDTLAYDFLYSWRYRNKDYDFYDWMARDFFNFLRSQDTTQQYWLAMGSRSRVYREGIFEAKALRCYGLANEAVIYEAKGMSASANQRWRQIFGAKFK